MARSTDLAEKREWSRGERQRALESVFVHAGFEPNGDDWRLEYAEVRWNVFFASIPDDEGERHDVSYSALLMHEGSPVSDWAYLINQALSDLPAASRREYRHVDTAVADPLVVDSRVLLAPLARRLSTPEAILDAWLSGELGWATWHRSDQIARVWKLAREYGFSEYAERAEALAAVGSWTPEDRWILRTAGIQVSGVVREPRPLNWWTRIRRSR